MANGTFFDAWINYLSEVECNGATPPSATGFYGILCTSTSGWDRTTSAIATVVGTEVASSNGYSRQSYNPSSASYNTSAQRSELPTVSLTWSATGGDIMWDTIAFLADAIATRGDTTGRLVAFYKTGSTQTISPGVPLVVPLTIINANIGFVSGV